MEDCMKAVILGKSTERLIPHKNYRPFYGEMSLMDLLIEKLIKVLSGDDIYLSCESDEFRYIAEKWGINFTLRESAYASYNASNTDVVANVAKSIPYNGDLLWCSCVEPFFNEYIDIIELWHSLDKKEHDSLNVVYPMKKFMLDRHYNPIGFGFGHWHKYSQTIPPIYQISWATCILSRECIEKTSYPVGRNPYWYDSYAHIIDIDTLDDFRFASLVYKAMKDDKNEKRQ
jgi:N-acylneuraminate cytidylyltransferase